MKRLLWLLTALAMGWAHLALANPICEPTSLRQVHRMAKLARQAIAKGDLPTHSLVTRELDAAIPCLKQVIAPKAWATSLVSRAVVASSKGSDWHTDLANALYLVPTIDRQVGPTHELYAWEPPPRPTPTPVQIPPGTNLWIDGVPVTNALPSLDGLHVAQRDTPKGLTSVLIQPETPLPDGWVLQPNTDQRLACEPMDRSWFNRLAKATQRAIHQGNLDAYNQASTQLESGIPCLEQVISRKSWARFLVSRAIVTGSRGNNWRTDLANALYLVPTIDRQVGPAHECYAWEPPPRPEPTPVQIPWGTNLWIDGVPVTTTLPSLAGRHVAQRYTPKGLTSVLIQPGTPLPDGWVLDPK